MNDYVVAKLDKFSQKIIAKILKIVKYENIFYYQIRLFFFGSDFPNN